MGEEDLVSVTWTKIRQRAFYCVCQQADDKLLHVQKCAMEGTVCYRGNIFVRNEMSVWKQSRCDETYQNYVVFRNNM